ncbi:MAG: lycopene cyclase family protein, partial [Methylophilaceae bacterium]
MGQTKTNQNASSDQKISVYDIVIIGGGTAGISVAASILKRRPDLSVAIIEP